ncbi:MAG: RIO-type serine/threonine-protein kinase Rio2 [Candidatus Heimdallarchaeota archaeon LC_3]|nr:MAG: RIO-type serine/threonine-protein kinase Rio2 [Candidatus Heimdallarchaeota archaeon LC_3]
MKTKFTGEFLSLNQKDFRILAGIERLMITQKYPRVQELPKETGYSYAYIQKKLRSLHAINLIEIKRNYDEYYETALNFNGYDVLAFNALVKKGLISSIGHKIGEGKESEIYTIQNDDKKIGVIKIHYLGKGNFRSYKKLREYLAIKHHSSSIYNSRLAAHHEAKSLKRVEGIIPVPRVWGVNRHCLLMDYIEGIELYKCGRIKKEYLRDLYQNLLQIIKDMLEIGIIHGDLSPYNILVSFDSIRDKYFPYIIDWPQSVNINHPNAQDILTLDVSNIIEFFAKRISIPDQSIDKIVSDLMK